MKYYILGLIASVCSVCPANADAHIYLKNCSDYPVDFKVYDGADSLALVPYTTGRISKRDPKSSDASEHKTSCSFGEKCKLRLTPKHFDKDLEKVIAVESQRRLHITTIEPQYFPYPDANGTRRFKSAPVATYEITRDGRECKETPTGVKVVKF